MLSPYKKPLIKIAVEGGESGVIRGAEKVIENLRTPLSLKPMMTAENSLEAGYATAALSDRRFLLTAFLSAPETNFLAHPKTISPSRPRIPSNFRKWGKAEIPAVLRVLEGVIVFSPINRLWAGH